MKKKTRFSLAILLACVLAIGAAAAGAVKIAAELRPDISVELAGKTQALTDRDGNRLYPISYKGTTYLPIRSVGELLGCRVDWDSDTQTVALTPAQQSSSQTGGSSASQTETSAGSLYQSYEDQIAKLEKRVAQQEAALQGAGDAVWRQSLSSLSELDRAIDQLDDALERDAKSGKLTRAEYRALDDSLDALEDRLDRLEDRAEDILDLDD